MRPDRGCEMAVPWRRNDRGGRRARTDRRRHQAICRWPLSLNRPGRSARRAGKEPAYGTNEGLYSVKRSKSGTRDRGASSAIFRGKRPADGTANAPAMPAVPDARVGLGTTAAVFAVAFAGVV